MSLIAGAALLSTMAIPAPATADQTSFEGAPVLLSQNTVDLLSDETIKNAIERYQAEQEAAVEAQEERKSIWRSERAAAIAAQLAAELAEREAEAAQQAQVAESASPETGTAGSAAGTSGPTGSVASVVGSVAPASAPDVAVPAPAPRVVAPAVPSGSGFTGVPNVGRTVVNGDITVTQAGQVLDSVDVHGRVIIKAPNVTIKNSVIRGADGGSANGIVDQMSGQPGLKIYDTLIAATKPNPSVNGIMGWNFELHNVEITNVIDAVHIAGSNVLIADSWLHDTAHYPAGVDPHHSDGSHDDIVQIVGGSNITITRSVLEGSYNAAVMIAPDRSAISNVSITNNTIDGGGCSINISEKGKGALPGITVANNRFGYDTRHAGCAIVSPASTHIAGSNTWLNGGAVSITKGS